MVVAAHSVGGWAPSGDGRDRTTVGLDVDRAGLEILDRVECLRLLATATIGRIAVSVRALPVILPVRFVLDGDRILVRAHAGTTLEAATRDAVVAFEADAAGSGVDPDWSVLVTGIASQLGHDEHDARAGTLALPRWSFECPDRIVAISTDRMSGRRGVVDAQQVAQR